jgi:hypothetical protein
MSSPPADLIPVTGKRPWRRLAVAWCDDCEWRFRLRAYQSLKDRPLQLAFRALWAHGEQTGHDSGDFGLAHY